MKIYTRKGDAGDTGLFHGGRVPKDAPGPEAYGAVDEAVAALGVARAIAGEDVAPRILAVQRALFVVAAELATDPSRRDRLNPGVSLVTEDLITDLEREIDAIEEASGLPDRFVVPGGDPVAAALDVARTVVRRAERRAVAHLREVEGSMVVPYLNRLSDYLYALARAVEGDWVPSRVEET